MGRYAAGSLIVLAALMVSGCRPDAVPAEATEIGSTSNFVDEGLDQEGSGVSGEAEGANAAAVTTSLDDDLFGSFGLLAPTVPGLALGTYASACDPFEDSFGSCL